MAKAYRAPIDPPVITNDDYRSDAWMEKENAYIEELRARARKTAAAEGITDDIIGEIVRWPRGDGYAEYMVWRKQPVELIHIATGDAWQVEDALIRGLRLTDIREMVERERRWAELFRQRKEANP